MKMLKNKIFDDGIIVKLFRELIRSFDRFENEIKFLILKFKTINLVFVNH